MKNNARAPSGYRWCENHSFHGVLSAGQLFAFILTPVMASTSGDASSGTVGVTNRALVRRFTDELSGDTVLEQATKDAQKTQDALDEENERERLSMHFKSIPADNK